MPNTAQQKNALAWRLQDAKAQCSALVDIAMSDVPQHVTRSGKRVIVVMSEQDFDDLQRSAASRLQAPAGFIEHLLSKPKTTSGVIADATGNKRTPSKAIFSSRAGFG